MANLLIDENAGRATIGDVARAAGVSPKTVSRVFNREPNVRECTRERVQKVIESLNYEPNPYARYLSSLRTQKSAASTSESVVSA